MKSKVFKIILGSLGGVILLGFVILAVWVGRFFFLMGSTCGNEILESLNSPNGTKKVVVFVRNCGATTDWSTQASIIGIDDALSSNDTGNAMIIDPDYGKAKPLAIKGWAIIKAKWENPNLLNLHHSKDAAVYFQDEKIGNVEIKFIPITKAFVESEKLEVQWYTIPSE